MYKLMQTGTHTTHDGAFNVFEKYISLCGSGSSLEMIVGTVQNVYFCVIMHD